MVRTTSATTDTMSFAREPLPKTTAIQLFKSLYLARRSEEYIVKHYPENPCARRCICRWARSSSASGMRRARGQGRCLRPTSQSRRLRPDARHRPVLLELYGRTSGTGEGKGGSMHLAAPDQGHILSSGVVATQISSRSARPSPTGSSGPAERPSCSSATAPAMPACSGRA